MSDTPPLPLPHNQREKEIEFDKTILRTQAQWEELGHKVLSKHRSSAFTGDVLYSWDQVDQRSPEERERQRAYEAERSEIKRQAVKAREAEREAERRKDPIYAARADKKAKKEKAADREMERFYASGMTETGKAIGEVAVDCTYAEREIAKKHGCKWRKLRKQWFAPSHEVADAVHAELLALRTVDSVLKEVRGVAEYHHLCKDCANPSGNRLN